MTNETQDEGPLKPQVIELSAEDVTEVKPEEAQPKAEVPPHPLPPHPLPPKPVRRSGTWRWLALALLIGAAGGGWIYRDLLSSYFPSGAQTALENRMGALEASNKEQNDRITAMIESIDAANATSATLDKSVRDVAGAFAAAQGRFDAADQKLASLDGELAKLKSELKALRDTVALGGGGSANGTADAGALAALGQRIDALEKDVASLKSAGTPAGGESQAAALSQALSDLKAKIATGAAFPDEYDRIARMVPAAPGLDVLASFAASGLPAAAGLATELHDLSPGLPAPAAPETTEAPGYWDSFWGAVTSIITIRDIGTPDWRLVAEDAAKLAEGGDLTGAIARIDAAEGAKPAALSLWRDRAANRLKLETALEECAGAVLRQITALGGTQ